MSADTLEAELRARLSGRGDRHRRPGRRRGPLSRAHRFPGVFRLTRWPAPAGLAALKGKVGGELHRLAIETAARSTGRIATVRFRPLANSGMVVSVITLVLADSPTRQPTQEWRRWPMPRWRTDQFLRGGRRHPQYRRGPGPAIGPSSADGQYRLAPGQQLRRRRLSGAGFLPAMA